MKVDKFELYQLVNQLQIKSTIAENVIVNRW